MNLDSSNPNLDVGPHLGGSNNDDLISDLPAIQWHPLASGNPSRYGKIKFDDSDGFTDLLGCP